MGGQLKVDWQESADQLKHLYQKEVHPRRRTRLQALWQLRLGKRIQDVVDLTGASYRRVQQWLQWYRQGGLSEVLRRVVGHHAKGKKPYLNQRQAKGPGGQGATGPVPNSVGCNRVGPGSLGGEIHL